MLPFEIGLNLNRYMADSALRMVLLLGEIPEDPVKVSVSELIARGRSRDPCFNVSRRTVERDLQNLSRHFPIEFDGRSKPGGWSFRKGERLVFPSMPDAEAITLIMAEQMLSDLLPPGVLNEIKPLVHKAQAKMYFGGARPAASWPQKVKILRNIPKRLPAEVDQVLLNDLYEAVFKERQIEVRYLKIGANEPEVYLLNPLALVLREPVIYLICTKHGEAKLMHWPVHRFRSVRRTIRNAEIPPGFDLQRELDKGLMGYSVSGQTIKLKLRFPESGVGRFLIETPLAADQTFQELDEQLIVEATVKDTLELRWWILAFGPRVEVLGPPGFRQVIGDSFNKAALLYIE